MEATLELTQQNAAALAPLSEHGLPALPWRDPHTVPPEDRRQMIKRLEQACQENPHSADLRTCLALVHAVNYDPHSSMASLERALEIDPANYFAQLKTAELYYRLRALPRAEEEAKKALNMAKNPREYQMARGLLQEIRRLSNNSWARPTWDKPMLHATLGVAAIVTAVIVGGLWY